MDQDEFFESLAREGDNNDVEILEVVAVEEDLSRPPDPAPARPVAEEAVPPANPSAGYGSEEQFVHLPTLDPEDISAQHALLRLRADYDNMRKRIDRERRDFQSQANSDLIGRLLPVLDNFERALALSPGECPADRLLEGLELVYRHFSQELRREGLRAIEALGHPFDPHLHDAVATGVSESAPAETVLEEFQRGYMFQDRVLRPALVRVSSGAEGPGADGSADPSSEGRP